MNMDLIPKTVPNRGSMADSLPRAFSRIFYRLRALWDGSVREPRVAYDGLSRAIMERYNVYGKQRS